MSIDLIIRLLAQKDGSIKSATDDVKKDIEDVLNDIQGKASQMVIGFGALAGAVAMVGKNLVDQASEMEQFKAKLETVLKSSVAARESIRYAVEYAAKTPFDVQGVVHAMTTLTVYGNNAKQTLPLVGDLAAGMGKSIRDTALVMAKAWSGSLEGFESLRNEYGITIPKLRQYGGAVNDLGEISNRSTTDINKNRAALEAIIKMDFAGAVDRQSQTFKGAFSNLQDTVSKLAVALGERLLPALTDLSKQGTVLMDNFSTMPVLYKDIIVGTGTLLGGIGALGVGIGGTIGIVAAYKVALIELERIKTKLIAVTTALNAANAGSPPSMLLANIGGGFSTTADLTAKYAGLFSRLPGYLAIAGVAYIGLNYAIQRYMETQREIGKALEEESKSFQSSSSALRRYIGVVNEAGKDSHIVVKTTSDMAEQLRQIKTAVDSIDVVKLTEILTKSGISTEEIKKEKVRIDEQLSREQIDVRALKTLRATRTYYDKEIPYEYQDMQGRWQQGVRTQRTLDNESGFDYKRLRGAVPDDVFAAMEDMVTRRGVTPANIDDTWLKSKQYKEGQLQGQKKIIDPAAQYVEELSTSYADASKSVKSVKSWLDLSDKIKGADAYIERLRLLKGLTNDISGRLIEQGITPNGTYQEALEKYKDPKTNEKAKEMIKLFLETKAEEIDAQKKADDEKIKSGERVLDKLFSQKKKSIESEEALGKVTAEGAYQREVALANKLRAITQEGKAQGKMSVNGKEIAPASENGWSVSLPDAESEKIRRLYKTDAEYRKKVDAELLELDKGNVSSRKQLQSDAFSKMKETNEVFLTSQRLAHKNDIAQEISDNALLVKQYEEAAQRKKISEKDAQSEIVRLRQSTMTLTKQLQEQERDNAVRYGAAQNAASDLNSKKYERELKAGKDVQGAIIRESEGRLQREMQLIDLRAQKEIESAGASEMAKRAIMLETENAKRAAISKEQDYINGLIQNADSIESRLEAISKKYEGDRIGGANSPLKSMQQAMEENGAIFADGGKKAPQTEMQKYLASLDTQANATNTLNTTMGTLNDSVIRLAGTMGGDKTTAVSKVSSPIQMSKDVNVARQQVVDEATRAQQSPGEALKQMQSKDDFYKQISDKSTQSGGGVTNISCYFNGQGAGSKDVEDSAQKTAEVALKFMTANGHLKNSGNIFGDNATSGSIFGPSGGG